MSKNKISVGVDLGGTSLRAAAADSSGKIIHRIKTRAPRGEKLRPALIRIFRRWKIRPDFLTIGSKGVGKTKARGEMKRLLLGLSKKVEIKPDFEIAQRSAFGSGPGIIVVAGTGSSVWGRDSCGHAARAGGLGPLLGDEGSAFWIGKEWLKPRALSEKKIGSFFHRRDAIRRIAAYAPKVLQKISHDPAARRIIEKGQRALIAQARDVARQLHFKENVPISWHGGLFDDAYFRKTFLRRLSQTRPHKRWDPRPPQILPEIAAALLPFYRKHKLRDARPNYRIKQ